MSTDDALIMKQAFCSRLVSDEDRVSLLFSNRGLCVVHPEAWLKAGLPQLTAAQQLHMMKLIVGKMLQTGFCPLEV